jgi:hypothetical protein
MEEQFSLTSLSAAQWRNILPTHHNTSVIKYNGGRGYKTILKAIFRCKIASKKVHLLLIDEFFFEAFKERGWRT